jgi:hypothetical protein
MSLALPRPVAAYFAAEKAADADALAQCFVEEGIVRDEGGKSASGWPSSPSSLGSISAASRGIGYLIAQAEGVFDTTGVFAGMAVLALWHRCAVWLVR